MPYKDPLKQKAAQRRYYVENHDLIVVSKNKRRNLMRRKIQEIKGSTPCSDCKELFPHYIMDFDHLPGESKLYNISTISLIPSMESLEKEIKKCDVVCSNCHRHRTFMRNTKLHK